VEENAGQAHYLCSCFLAHRLQ